MTNLENTITGLNEILTAVNELPSQRSVKLQEKSVTPTSSAQAVVPDSGYDGLSKVNVSGDSNLVPDNIKNGVSIFGVTGSMSGGVEVQVATGRITTSSSGTATVSCGFRPDLVVFHIATFASQGENYECVICFPIGASKNNNGANLDSCSWESGSSTDMIEGWIDSITNTGVSVGFYKWGTSSNGYLSRKTLQWTAVKYTA